MDHLSSGSAKASRVETHRFRLWGRFAATRLADNADVTPRGRKARALLALLLLEDKAVARDQLAGLLWSERGQAQAHASLRQCLQELREFAPMLGIERHQLSVDGASGPTDLAAILAAAEASDAVAMAKALAEGRDLLEDLDGIDPAFDQWLRAVRATQGGALIAAAHACGGGALERGSTDAAEALARTLLAIDPLDEAAARLAMASAHKAGRQEIVKRVHDQLAADLDRELGVTPSSETQALRERLTASVGTSVPVTSPATDEGDDKESEPSSAPPTSRSRWRRWTIAGSALLLLVAAASALVVPRLLDRGAAEPASLAVLPFRNLSGGDNYFAEGVAEEILTQLAREPQLRVAGRTSSWLFKDRAADLRDVGRRLDVAYVLEGSVRRAGDRVRVDVALVGTRDGMRLWSHAFQGRLDDVFAIQSNIGREVTNALRLRFVQAAPPARDIRTSGEVYSLYLTARGLIRTRNTENLRTAEDLLRRAIRLDSSYAPAWSSLGQAVKLSWWTDLGARDAQALRYVNRALALAPGLAEAHAVKGMILGFGEEASRSLERAVQLNPRHAEAWHWLANAHYEQGNDDAGFEASRRVAELDPFWINSVGFTANAWDRGLRAETMRFELNLAANHPEASHRELARARIAERRGDWSASALHLRRAAELDSGDSEDQIRNDLAATLLLVDLPTEWSGHAAYIERTFDRGLIELRTVVMNGEIPQRASIVAMLGGAEQFWEFLGWNLAASRLLLSQNRAVDLVHFYDSAFGSPEAMAASGRTHGFAMHAPTVALALREAGRREEADRLLALAERRTCRRELDSQRISGLVACSRIWAVQGRRETAVIALQRASARGWPNGFVPSDEWQPRPVLADEPAWRALRDDGRFRQIDMRIRAQLARERRELQAAFANRPS